VSKQVLRFVLPLLALCGVAATVVAHDDEPFDNHDQQSLSSAYTAQMAAANSNAPLSHAPCVRGFAGEFPCDKIDLLSFVPLSALGGTWINDIWGWTDPETKRDYALVGMLEGLAIVDIADPKRPTVMGLLPTHSTDGGDLWRDVKVYGDHAFVVSENENHGMQVLDLTQLRDTDVSSGPVTFVETAHYDGIGDAHNIAINEDTGFAYIVGSDDCLGGPHMVDVSDPANPAFAGCFSEHKFSHDTQCVLYHGNDTDYLGREICFGSNVFRDPDTRLRVNTLSIADVSNKNAPVGIANATYDNSVYSHQGWLTPDHSYFLHGDELDERAFGHGTRTRIWDVTDLDDPSVLGVFENTTFSIDHNIYAEGRYAFASNYTSGLRIYDLKKVANGTLTEVAYFDVYPESDLAIFQGTWSNYPFFGQKGVVAVSSIDRGLFILNTMLGKSGN
jgi:choice-of-anchor B domain-containing protein